MKKFALISLLFAAAALPAFAADEKLLTKTDVENIIRSYLGEHPEIIIESVQKMQQKQVEEQSNKAKESIKANKDKLLNKNTPFTGNPKGDVTVIEFFDYNCGYCKHVVEPLAKLAKEDKNVKIAFFDLPILSPDSEAAAKYSIAVGRIDGGKYFDFYQAMMKATSHREEDVMAIAKSLGIDQEKLKKEAASKEVEEIIKEHLALAPTLGIQGTPAFVIGDDLIPGAADYDTLVAKVKQAREKK